MTVILSTSGEANTTASDLFDISDRIEMVG